MKPKLSAKARVRRDPRDGAAILLAPERGLRLSQTAEATVALADGTRTIDEMVEALASRYPGADRRRIEADVRALLGDLHGRALLEGFDPAGAGVSAGAAGAHGLEPSALAVQTGDEAPYTLVAELTHRCPLACPYCSNPRQLVRGSDELRTEEWQRVIDEAAAFGVMQVHLSGGEPLARSDLEAVAAHARSRDLYVNLVTSGVPLERPRLERLAASIDHVQLSVQDADGASSDRIAGTASFDAKLRVARWVKELGLPLTLNVVMHRENLDRVDAVIALAEELRADRLELANVQFISWANANASALLPTRAQIERARSAAHAARARLAGTMELVFVLPDWHAGRPRACMDGWGRRFVVVAPDGYVLPCHAARSLPLAFESVRGRSLAAAWRDASGMNEFRGAAWLPEPCRTCDRREVDFAGCRCQAFALTGDARATDPACELAPQHSLVRAAREEAEKHSERVLLYRGR
jgi:pyrroloquinoline quinone biosynthesis protein E